MTVCVLCTTAVSGADRGIRHHQRALALREWRVHGQVFVSVDPRRRPRLLVVRLNGHRLDRFFVGVGARRRVARVGADDGLRYGVNRLRVTAAAMGGRVLTRTLRFRIARDRPLAGAGGAPPIQAGTTVRLDGRSSRAMGGGRLRYRWRIVGRPRGSHARLLGAGRSRPRLITDRPGHYRVALTLTESTRGRRGAARASTDVVDVAAQTPLPVAGARVIVDAGHGSADTIDVAGRTFQYGGSGNEVTAIVFDRSTLAFSSQTTVPDSAIGGAQLSAALHALGNSSLVILAGDDGSAGPLNSAFAGAFAALGASYPAGGCSACTVIGVPGAFDAAWLNPSETSAGSGTPEAGDTRGYLQLNASGTAYTFVPGQYASFDTSSGSSTASGPTQPDDINTMTVGAQTFTSSGLTGCGNGGFQLVILDSQTLALVSNTTFTTDGCNGSTDLTAVTDLANAIRARPAHDLMLLQGIGVPVSSGAGFAVSIELSQIGRLLAQIGGAYGDFESPAILSGPAYALVTNGSTSVQASSGAPGNPPARLTGLLSRDRASYSWAPSGGPGAVFSAEDNPAATELAPIAYQAPTAWPSNGRPGYEAALQWISAHVLGISTYNASSSCDDPPGGLPDVRSSYCSGVINGTLSTKLSNTPYPSGQNFSSSTYDAVRAELLNVEFPEVERVETVFANLETPLKAAAANISVPVGAVQDAINAAIADGVSDDDAVGSGFSWSGLLSAIAGFGWALLPEGAGQAAGVVSEAFAVGGVLSTGLDGSPQLGPSLPGTTVGEYEQSVASRYQDAVAGFETLKDMILSDSGRLQRFYNSGIVGENAPSTAAMTSAIELGEAQSAWTTLLPVAYQTDLLVTTEGNLSPDPTKYACNHYDAIVRSPVYTYPFHAVGAAGQYAYTVPATGQQEIAVLAGPGNPSDTPSLPSSATTPSVPPQDLIAGLFEPVGPGYDGAVTNAQGTGAAPLGIDPAVFYEHDAIPAHQLTVTCTGVPGG